MKGFLSGSLGVRFKDTPLCFRLCVLGVQKQNATLKTIHHFQYIENTEL